MIFDLILTPLLTVLEGLFSLLPTWSLLGALGLATSGAGAMGQSMAIVEPIFPVSASLTMVIAAYTILLSVFTAYKVANWGYRHLPEILGCGPGGGG